MSEEEPYVPNGGVFVGARDPVWDLEHEQPWHNTASYLFATGKSAKWVATAMGKSQPAVQNLLRQPWFQKKVTKLLAQEGNKDISKLFQAEQYSSLTTLVQLRDDPEVPAAVRANVCKDILDRSLGKPTQRVEVAHEAVSDDPVEEVRRLEEENARLRDELST
jgi:hypothetical protein